MGDSRAACGSVRDRSEVTGSGKQTSDCHLPFPAFSFHSCSDRKRMSVIVRTPSGQLRLYCKGAVSTARLSWPPRPVALPLPLRAQPRSFKYRGVRWTGSPLQIPLAYASLDASPCFARSWSRSRNSTCSAESSRVRVPVPMLAPLGHWFRPALLNPVLWQWPRVRVCPERALAFLTLVGSQSLDGNSLPVGEPLLARVLFETTKDGGLQCRGQEELGSPYETALRAAARARKEVTGPGRGRGSWLWLPEHLRTDPLTQLWSDP